MSTNYTGSATAADSPSPAPTVGGSPIIVLPADADPRNAATMFTQQYKMTADWLAGAMKAAQRVDDCFYFEEDFTGSAVSTGKWNADPSFTMNDGTDTGTNVCGSAKASLASGTSKTLQTPLGTALFGSMDLRLRARIRITAMGGTSSTVRIGLTTSSNNMLTGISADSGTANWRWISNGTFTAGSVAWGSTYQILEIIRSGTNWYWLIDGVQIGTSTIAVTTLTSIQYLVSCATSGTTTAYIDWIKMWAGRGTGL